MQGKNPSNGYNKNVLEIHDDDDDDNNDDDYDDDDDDDDYDDDKEDGYVDIDSFVFINLHCLYTGGTV
uniref:Uncharacterized protein n=1 Tax=Glossina morsitans morsitans TaxID=37546 RepID=A0A1B0G794_GLOMM